MGFIGFFIEKPKTHSAEFENVGFSHPWLESDYAENKANGPEGQTDAWTKVQPRKRRGIAYVGGRRRDPPLDSADRRHILPPHTSVRIQQNTRRRHVDDEIEISRCVISNQSFLVIYHCCLRTKNVKRGLEDGRPS